MSDAADPTVKTPAAGGYRVLARTYRPESFDDAFIGQDALVRTLTNAFETNRLAHAFILTGVRGVGKTTTARIIARALNCVGPDGTGGPTIHPCGMCEFCRAINDERLVDVIEMDAASRTGVDDIRELIDGVRYRPVSARYKVYIIDEVHMLTRNAFNALLKTLEEPPSHVKFIFATTEIRKVPVTVLSRCQRFDLRRVDTDTLARHFAAIAEKESVKIDEAAIRIIARAADGSVRDGLSLLDQAVAAGSSGAPLGEDAVRAMLGLADRSRSFELFEQIMAGDAAGALSGLAADYAGGADPVIVLQDLLDVVHWVTRLKVASAAADDPMIAELDRQRGKEFAERLGMAELTRAWQMLLKGVREAAQAPHPLQAAEMILIRLAYLTELPSPADAVRALSDGGNGRASAGAGAAPPSAPRAQRGAGPSGGVQAAVQSAPAADPAPAETQPADAQHADTGRPANPQSFNDVIALAEARGESMLRAELVKCVHLVSFQPGHIEVRLAESSLRDLPNRLIRFLNEATDSRWMVTLAQAGGAETVGQQMAAAEELRREELMQHPVMRSILETFPGAELEQIKSIGAAVPVPSAVADTIDAAPIAVGDDDPNFDADADGDLDL